MWNVNVQIATVCSAYQLYNKPFGCTLSLEPYLIPSLFPWLASCILAHWYKGNEASIEEEVYFQNPDPSFLPFKMAAKILKLDLDQNIWFKCITSVYCCLYSALCSLQGIGLAFWDFTDNLLRFSGICLTTYKEIWKYFNIPNTYPQKKIRGLDFLTKIKILLKVK